MGSLYCLEVQDVNILLSQG